jgi:hypothetical protein
MDPSLPGQNSAVNYRHLLAVGVVLPVLLALANQAVLQPGILRHLQGPTVAALFCFYALQIGLVSWAAATVRPWPLRWAVFAWIMLLVDLQLAILTQSTYSEPTRCLASGVIAAQLSLFVVWGVLARGAILWRLPSVLVLLAVAWNFYQALVRVGRGPVYYFGWSDLVLMQTVLLMLLCGSLRLFGFSLDVTPDADLAEPQAGGVKARVQFGIRDVLIGTTSLAVVLALAKAADLLTLKFVRFLYDHGFLLVLTIASATAAVQLVALWAALGRGGVIARLVTLVAVSLAVGMPIGWYCDSAFRRTIAWNGPWWLYQWYQTGYWWIGWMFLTASLLAAALVIYRRLGYRLVRFARQGSSVPSFSSASS